MKKNCVMIFLFFVFLYGISMAQKIKRKEEMLPFIAIPHNEILKRLEKYSPTEISIDPSSISKNNIKLLGKLIESADIIDHIFWMQVSRDGLSYREKLKKIPSTYTKDLLRFLEINYGVFDRLDKNKPFITNAEKPGGATFYPVDMKKQDFEKWIEKNPKDKDAFISPYTVIKKRGEKELFAVPYSKEYENYLKLASRYLKEASEITENQSLKKFLQSRAEAFLSNDYFQSDIDWMDVEGSEVEVTIGPYEVYEDALFNYKASFESFITIVDMEESKKLMKIAGFLDELENNLPIPKEYKNFERGRSSPIKVVNVLYTSGDTRAGVQTIAYNLPNDEKVREIKGSKKVILKNVCEAKFKKILVPIAKKVIKDEDLKYLSFNAFFNEILMHEVSHGLGPGFVKNKNGKKVAVNILLKEMYSTIEEAKADVMGFYNSMYLIHKGVFQDELFRQTAVTYLAGIFRAIRFGVEEAHGKANIIQLNYLQEKGAFDYDKKRRKFGINFDKLKDGIKLLLNELLILQAKGDYDAAVNFVKKYSEMKPEIKTLVDKFIDIPVDIYPVYSSAKKIMEMK